MSQRKTMNEEKIKSDIVICQGVNNLLINKSKRKFDNNLKSNKNIQFYFI